MNELNELANSSRSEQRREQVLDAAAKCFRERGFHGASIAQISKQAQMSAGHIYHFFDNKEAIIAAIVERRMQHAFEVVERFEAADDIFEAIVENVQWGFDHKTDPDQAALWVEVLAEAARNPQVGEIVTDAAKAVCRRFVDVTAKARHARGVTTDTELSAVSNVIMAMFEGLTVRVIQNPDLQRDEVLKVLRVATRAILEA